MLLLAPVDSHWFGLRCRSMWNSEEERSFECDLFLQVDLVLAVCVFWLSLLWVHAHGLLQEDRFVQLYCRVVGVDLYVCCPGGGQV